MFQYLTPIIFLILIQHDSSMSQRWGSQHLKLNKYSDHELRTISGLVSEKDYFNEVLHNILVPRVVGSSNHTSVIKYISKELENLGWNVELDTFTDRTPIGDKTFTNIIATPNKHATQYLDLACHFDSKLYKHFVFHGASDSAVPCAMMLMIASSLNKYLKKVQNRDLNLRLIFFDGEEAFVSWTDTDSLYGSRHLAQLWESTPFPEAGRGFTQLHKMRLLVLLDLLGPPNPKFYNFFSETVDSYTMLVNAETKLKEKNLIQQRERYFRKKSTFHKIEDDHIPFLRRGVPVVHVIPIPFPRQWHTAQDNYDAIDFATVDNLVKIFTLFVVDYLGLPVED